MGARACGTSSDLLDVAGTMVGFALCDSDGSLLAMNGVAARVLGIVGGDPDGAPKTFPLEVWEQLQDALPAHPVLSLGEPKTEVEVRRYETSRGYLVVLLPDPSELRHCQLRSVHQKHSELLARLAATLVHDLRTPLASIAFNADMMAESVANEGEIDGRFVAAVRSAAVRLQTIVNRLQLIAHQGGPSLVPTSLADICGRVCSRLHGQFRPKNRSLRCEVSPEARWALANPILLEEVLVELVGNSAEATDAGLGVRIVVGPDVGEGAPDPQPRVRLRVTDNGPGVDSRVERWVFEPFVSGRCRSGLGLALAREAIRGMGGDLVHEPATKGTSFSVLLNRAEPLQARSLERP